MSRAFKSLRIALVGDQSPHVKAHAAIPKALALAKDSSCPDVSGTWVATTTLANGIDQLRGFNGIWCVPGSPYASMEGALQAIRFARESRIPLLSTCGGCQHALIEYCRNVLGLREADHAESNPDARLPLIAPLPCALREVEARIHLKTGSRVSKIYGRNEISEPFNCGFGPNPDYQHLFANGALRITGADADGVARVVELNDHPFFIATLFQPERSALKGVHHPLITAFVQAVAASTKTLKVQTNT